MKRITSRSIASIVSKILGAVLLAACAPAQPAATQAPAGPTQTRLPSESPTQNTINDFDVQSDLIRELLQQGPEAGKCLVYGMVSFAGQPITNQTDTPPSFWVRDEDKGGPVDTEVVYDPLHGEYLYSLPAGTFGISAIVELGKNYPTPGDYTSWTQVTVEDGQLTLNQHLALRRIIHLTSPFDNMEPLDLVFDPQLFGHIPLMLESKTVLFSWDAIPEASAYLLTITEVELNPAKNLPWKNIQTYFDDRITDTSLEIELPSSPEDHFYSARLYAKDQAGDSVGSLMISLADGGYGWDLQFRIP